MSSNTQLNPLYSEENQLQAINHRAARIERATGLSVVRAHLGNPLGPQYAATNRMLSGYFARREGDPESFGYANVVGPDHCRRAIAAALCRINRLPEGCIGMDNIIGATGGTGALNIAMSIAHDSTVLVSEPYYPPWNSISQRIGNRMATFPLRKEDDYLLNEEVLAERIGRIEAAHPGRPVTLIYHYPHNPTGKTLTEAEAEKVGGVLNRLCDRFRNLRLLQEDLYLATTAPELGIHTPLRYLDEQARKRTVWLNSPSKMGHPQDRGAVIAAFDPQTLAALRGAVSFDLLGGNMPALMATANTLMHIAQGGVEAEGEKGSNPVNHRFRTARYYQSRLKIVYDALEQIGQAAGASLLHGGMPRGAYYLYPSFDCLRGKPVPEKLRPALGKEHFENADDVAAALENAHLLGLRPVTVASGTLFNSDPATMTLRIATVEQDEGKLHDLGNTLKGLAEKTLGVNLGAEFVENDAAQRARWPVVKRAARPPYRWNRAEGGQAREWSLNP